MPAPWPSPSRGTRFRVGCALWLLALAVTSRTPAADTVGFQPERLAGAARRQIGVTVAYDPAYRRLAYPGGDVPVETGVCSDVIVRALRVLGRDLQREVHEDMKRDFDAYPKRWGLKKPDPNIDHRRVPNLMTYFQRRGYARKATRRAEDYRPGDLVTWDLGGGVTHIGIVSDRKTPAGAPLILHNIGRGTREAARMHEAGLSPE